MRHQYEITYHVNGKKYSSEEIKNVKIILNDEEKYKLSMILLKGLLDKELITPEVYRNCDLDLSKIYRVNDK